MLAYTLCNSAFLKIMELYSLHVGNLMRRQLHIWKAKPDGRYSPDVQFTWKHGIVAMVLWTNSPKRGKFLSFIIVVQVSRASGGTPGQVHHSTFFDLDLHH